MTDVFDKLKNFNYFIDEDDLPFGSGSAPFWATDEKKLELLDISRMDTGLPLYSVSYSVSDAEARKIAENEIEKKNSHSNDIYEVVRLDISLIPEKKKTVKYNFKETDCVLSLAYDPVIINETDATELNVGIRYVEKYYYLDGECADYPVDVVFALDDENYRIFNTYTEVAEKHKAMKHYAALTSAQRRFFRNQFDRPDQSEKKDSAIFTPIRDEKALRVLYETCKSTYSEATRVRAELFFSELGGHLGFAEKNDIINQLSHILSIDTQRRSYRKKGYDEIIALMDKHIYGLDDFKRRFGEFLFAMQYSKDSSFVVLLVGPPGVGKTSIGRVTAECCGKPFKQIDCSGADVVAMCGLVRAYGGAKAGKVADGFWEMGRTDAVVLFDEIDKLSVTNAGNPYSIFLKALGPEKLLHDEYIDADIDVSSTIFIATANCYEDIPAYVLNRFGSNVFFLDKYTLEEKTAIAKNFVLKRILDNFNIGEDELWFTDDALRFIAREYCEDDGVREIESYMKNLIITVRRLWYEGVCPRPLEIDEDFVREYLVKIVNNQKSNKAGF